MNETAGRSSISRMRPTWILAAPLLAAACFTGTRMGDAEVKLADSQLCIGVTGEESERLGDLKVQAIVVSDASKTPPENVWSTSSNEPEAPAVLLTKGRCFRYGEVPPGYTGSPNPPPRLEPDRLYHAYVNAVPAKGKRDGTQGYTVSFCILSSAPGRLTILPSNATSCTAP